MGHHQCCSKQKVKRGLWSPEEDEKLIRTINEHGHSCWSSVPKLAGLQRCGKSCRLRWINYLRPDLKRGSFSPEEEGIILDCHRILGNRWAQIAKHLPGRTDNEVKNFWNSCIKKKMMAQGLDPKTHNLIPSLSLGSNAGHLNHVYHQPYSAFSTISMASSSHFTLPSHEGLSLLDPNFHYQNSMNFDTQYSIGETSMNPYGSGVSDESRMWGGTTVGFFELPREEEMQAPPLFQQQQQQQEEQMACEVGFDDEINEETNKDDQDLETSFNSSSFDLEFIKSSMLASDMYNSSMTSMDRLAWDC
ncbi:hypothetical protein GIB67_016058 [Kingdonia uniflora]|uniref:Uncharacterized protein n=1 Tax=Kingdonia uniflora TaxID=39325 RepID=A0A7J7L215_9MAGN|nr:hypothetical protein GIB67_016058 [Kingdonia uniflora]